MKSLLSLSDDELREKIEHGSENVYFSYDACIEEWRDRRAARTNARIVAMTIVIAAATVANVVISLFNSSS